MCASASGLDFILVSFWRCMNNQQPRAKGSWVLHVCEELSCVIMATKTQC